MSKVIFVNRYFSPDQSATSQILSDLAINLASEKKLDVVVLTSRRVMSDPSIKLNKQENINGVRVKRVYTSSFGQHSLIGRTIDFIFFYVTSFFTLLSIASRNDLIIAKTDPPLVSIPCYIVSKIKRTHFVNWLQDIYPEVAIHLGVKGFDGVLGTFLTNLRNKILRQSSYNVVLGENMLSHVKSLGVSQDNIKIIHNWSDGKLIKPIDKSSNKLLAEWNLQDKFVVCYSGNMGRAHEFDTIIEAINKLKQVEDIVFIFIGGGAKKRYLEDRKAELGLNNLLFKPYQDFNKLAYSLSVGSLHLISLIPELEGLIVPSKLYGVLAVGRPAFFIGSQSSEIGKILQDGKCGRSFAIGDSDELANQILILYKSPELLQQLNKNARSIFMKRYDKEVAFAKWHELIEQTIFQDQQV